MLHYKHIFRDIKVRTRPNICRDCSEIVMFLWYFHVNNSEYDQEIPQLQTADKPVAS